MPRIITIDEKLAVIDDWLNGERRNQIAIKRNLGSGTVYNIIQEWRLGIGIEKADKLRDLALKLNKTGLTVNKCAIGLRTLMIFKKYGNLKLAIKNLENSKKNIISKKKTQYKSMKKKKVL